MSMSREEIKNKIKEIQISYDYHSDTNTYDVIVDLDKLTDLIVKMTESREETN